MFQIVAIIQGNHKMCQYREGFSLLNEKIKEQVAFQQFEIYDIDEQDHVLAECVEAIEKADFIYIHLHGGITYFKSYTKLCDLFVHKKPFYFYSGIESEIEELSKKGKISNWNQNCILGYETAGGPKNLSSLWGYISNHIGNISCTYEDVILPKWDGIYFTEQEYADEFTGNNHGFTERENSFFQEIIEETKPVIGILIHFTYFQHGNTKHIDALMKCIEKQGAVPYPIYTNVAPVGKNGEHGLADALRKYFMVDGKTIIDTLIVTTGMALSITSAPGSGGKRVESSVFEVLDVPILQGMTTGYTYEKWEESIAGLEPMFLSINVYQPEFDGQLISTVFAYTKTVETEFGATNIFLPIEERTDKLAKLAKNWAMLRHIPMEEKKVAIILHNMPPRVDMIGAAYGLDTPASVYQIVEQLVQNGLFIQFPFADGREIIDHIVHGLTNDGRFLSANQMLERADFVANPEQYIPWFSNYPEKVQAELLRDWGKAPGEFMVVDDKILVPGIVNGNLFIGLQPPRAFEEKAEEAYHSTDLVCPYQYLGFYHYLEHVFGANMIVHVGTHGTLEWLPGKEIGLSNSCYPDIAIGEMPHIYPYIIDVPGEGAQAKRRSSACILEHLIPSMKESGVYGELAEIEELITQYYKANGDNKEKMPLLVEAIWEAAYKQNMQQDIGLTKEVFDKNVEEGIEKFHLWISDIKTMEVKDGLHTFGVPPTREDDRMKNMLRLLVRVQNGEILSIRDSICRCKGFILDELLNHPEKMNNHFQTNAMIIDEIDELARVIFDELDHYDYQSEWIQEILVHNFDAQELTRSGELRDCLTFVCDKIYPNLCNTTQELRLFNKAIDGEFVLPGPSGSPSRGNADILPTGRNFYMIDPSTVPSKASYKVGVTLGNQLLDKYKEENGSIPENIAIIVYSGETIKTSGDDIAEILYLYGIRPKYLGTTDRVIGLEVISLEELGRPRIDVTLRISGLFRDTFPNLIELVDDAVSMVATLEEPSDMNFVRKHMLEDVKKFVGTGMDEELAIQHSLVRVFGCPPGTYGAGVDILVNSKQWETSDDLGQAYITWSGHGYTKQMHGDKLQNLFAHRLSTCDATVKNISSYEADMLDSDDFYNYHGGLISAVKKQKGVLPSSYSTNAGDTSHISTKNIHEETSKIMRARINNPQWIEGLKKHGFKGAQEFSAMVDIVFGWDATSDVVDDWMYDSIYETYLNDQELKDWIEEQNPWALHAMSERLLEASQRGMWDAAEDKLDKLREIYLHMEGDFEGI